MKAVIVGAGIGGLAVALCFRHAGWEVEVLERAPALAEVGAGLQLSPNAMKVIRAIGLEAQVSAVAFRPEAIEIRMGESGLDLIRTPLGDAAQKRWNAPYLHIHRADLVDVLSDALSTRAPGAVRLDAEIVGYAQTETHAEATLADGDRVKGDIVVGADGLRSNLRDQMLGPDTARFTGNTAWRAVVPIARLGEDAPRPTACAWMGRGRHTVTYRLRGGALANFVGVVEQRDWTEENWSQEGSREDAMRDFQGWHPTITRLIETADALYRWALFDRAPLKTWTDGRAALLGDAAHPMLPFMAQGAAMAIEDAWALAAYCASGRSPVDALIAYQKLRYARATAIQAGSRANAGTFHKRSFVGRLSTYGPMWLAGRIAPNVGLQRQDPVYSYDVTEAVQI